MDSLDFIKDEGLRKTLEDSIEFVYALYEQSKKEALHRLYQEETYRVIILYVVSAIEAILLYFYKSGQAKMESLEYKCVLNLPTKYEDTEKRGLPLVLAVQEKEEKKEHQIGLHDLVNFFRAKKLIRESTASDILDMNDVRNTFHFNKPRGKACDLARVEKALKLLLYTIQNAPASLRAS